MSAVPKVKTGTRLEILISILLITGVVLSMLLEAAGMLAFYRSYHNLDVSSGNSFNIHGQDFFTYVFALIRGGEGGAALYLMSLGIVVLVLTPYIRVVMSAIFFALEKDYKFVFITAFVLVVLTLSLALH